MLRTAFTDTWEEIDSFWFHRLVIIDKDYFQLILRLLGGSDKSFVDDLVASGYCKHESNLCVARCWGLSLVSMICSSLFLEEEKKKRKEDLIDERRRRKEREDGMMMLECVRKIFFGPAKKIPIPSFHFFFFAAPPPPPPFPLCTLGSARGYFLYSLLSIYLFNYFFNIYLFIYFFFLIIIFFFINTIFFTTIFFLLLFLVVVLLVSM